MTSGMTSPVSAVQSADVHGALTGIVSPVQLEAAAARRQHSSTSSGNELSTAMYEVGDWTERSTAASALLVSVTRLNSDRRAELMYHQQQQQQQQQQRYSGKTPTAADSTSKDLHTDHDVRKEFLLA